MKLNIMSDIHNEFAEMEIPQTDADVVILAGDIDVNAKAINWAKKFNKPIVYVAGNHEFYGNPIDDIKQEITDQCKGTDVHFLDDSEVIIDNVRFVGGTLWTDFQLFGAEKANKAIEEARSYMNDYRVITKKVGEQYKRLAPEDTIELHKNTRCFLIDKLFQEPFEGKTIVVTHHAPSLQSISLRYKNDLLTAAYASSLLHFMGNKASLWVHGHTHVSSDYMIEGTRVVCNPRGYQRTGASIPENEKFNPGLVVEI